MSTKVPINIYLVRVKVSLGLITVHFDGDVRMFKLINIKGYSTFLEFHVTSALLFIAAELKLRKD